MCTLILLHRCFPEAPLVMAANRDEYLDRPAETPALRNWEGVPLVAPRDARAGGTWLGLNRHGLFAGLTNRPARSPDPQRRSRGLVVADALAEPDARRAADRLLALPVGTYNPFQLLVADGRDAFVVVYDEKPRGRTLLPGPHVLGNADPDDTAVPKVARLLDEARRVSELADSDRALEALAATCRVHGAGQHPIDDTCIHAGPYGTRSSTLLRTGGPEGTDVLRFADGPPCENTNMEMTPLLGELDRTTGTFPEQSTRADA
jgi:uncharacterized protein with NRDE domain